LKARIERRRQAALEFQKLIDAYPKRLSQGWQLNTIVSLQAAQPWLVNDYKSNFSGTFDKPIQVETAFAVTGRPGVGLFGSGALDPNLRDSYTQQWNLMVQKKLPQK